MKHIYIDESYICSTVDDVILHRGGSDKDPKSAILLTIPGQHFFKLMKENHLLEVVEEDEILHTFIGCQLEEGYLGGVPEPDALTLTAVISFDDYAGIGFDKLSRSEEIAATEPERIRMRSDVMKEIASNPNLQVTVVRSGYRVRIWMASMLMTLAFNILGGSIEIVQEEDMSSYPEV